MILLVLLLEVVLSLLFFLFFSSLRLFLCILRVVCLHVLCRSVCERGNMRVHVLVRGFVVVAAAIVWSVVVVMLLSVDIVLQGVLLQLS